MDTKLSYHRKIRVRNGLDRSQNLENLEKVFIYHIILELYAYCGYPTPYYSEVMGFINEKILTLAYDYTPNEINGLHNDNESYSKNNHAKVFFDLKNSIKI